MGAKGRVVIPAAIRRRIGIEPGMLLDVTIEGDGIRLTLADRPAGQRLREPPAPAGVYS
jgi:AbrB family looped-hinge helix DNA binding protein